MTTSDRIEGALRAAVARLTTGGCPPQLAEAIEYAMFPAGNRLRPRLAIAVADALGGDTPLIDAAAVSLEFLHGASLIQDDMPAFDAAEERRGRPALHAVFGDAIAILAADALIIGAFETVARDAASAPSLAAALTLELARGTGSPHGAVAGQGWESEDDIDLAEYHRTKTAALFEAATAAGAVAAGHDPSRWRAVGHWLGRAYQIADDIADEQSPETGGSDAELGRPNALRALGMDGSVRVLDQCIRNALDSVPPCSGREQFISFLHALLVRFRPATYQSPTSRTGADRAAVEAHA